MKKILILGSKPNANITKSDHVYCANAAISFYEEEIKPIREITNIVSGGQISKHFRKKRLENKDHHEEKYRMILNGFTSRLIICNPRDDFEMKSQLISDGYKAPIEEISSRNRQLITQKITGTKEPIKPLTFEGKPLLHIALYYKEKTRSIIDSIRNVEHNTKGLFRPSIGIFCLIYAIQENGHNAEYEISGIGLRNRESYKTGRISTKRKTTPHLYADERILNELNKKFRLKTSEEELSQIVGQNVFTNK